jgi:hemolysin III
MNGGGVRVGEDSTIAVCPDGLVGAEPIGLGRVHERPNVPRSRPFGRPVWRGRMHTWAFFVAIPAGLLLVVAADGAVGRAAGAIYAMTVVALFGTSAAYHRLTRSERSRSIMQRIDHSMIYLLIAGTYAPFCLVALPPGIGTPLFTFVIALALTGIGLKVFAFDRARWWSYALYPTMSVVIVLAGPTLVRQLSATSLALVVGGTITYALGMTVLLTRRPDPWPARFGYHEVWHALTIVAAALHFVAIRSVLV